MMRSMPIYGYTCGKCGQTTEVLQSMSAAPLKTCSCGGDLKKEIYAAGIVFKGQGFYKTDYAQPAAKPSDSLSV